MKSYQKKQEASLLFETSDEPERRISSTGQIYCIFRNGNNEAIVSCNGISLGKVIAWNKDEMERTIDRLIIRQEEYATETAGLH